MLRNEPGLSAARAFSFAILIVAAGNFAALYLPSPANVSTIAGAGIVGAVLFTIADRRRYVRNASGKIVTDRWEIALRFGGFQWTRDKANRHFFFTGDTGSGKTSSGMNGLLDSLLRHNPRLGGMVMANKGDEWFVLQRLAKKHGREHDLIRLRPRIAGETLNETTLHRLNVTGDARFRSRPAREFSSIPPPRLIRRMKSPSSKSKAARTSAAPLNCSPTSADYNRVEAGLLYLIGGYEINAVAAVRNLPA